jgi:hypothetical protein
VRVVAPDVTPGPDRPGGRVRVRRVPGLTMAEYGSARRTITSRRRRRCDARAPEAGCDGVIEAGDTYESVTIFPGHDVLGAEKPYRLATCSPCRDWYLSCDLQEIFPQEEGL